ncbi:MAG: YqaJ viral recombinase family protein [Rhodoferax sp.]|nr:YqaJ viral recombinase family protein [Rhodoferax sp.]
MTYEVVSVTPDTPEWLFERRSSVGASEVAAVLGLSPYNTALDVYRSKQGVDRDFDPLLSFIGHESEHIIHKWVEEFSGVQVKLEPAFMARSTEFPFLHASFDRVSSDPFTTWQFKTAHFYTGHKWDEGIPTDIRVQVQAEMVVAGTQKAAVVVWIGGREFRLFWEPRDNRFIDEHMIPALTEFWAGVRDGVAPAPSNVAELAEAWPDDAGEMEAPEVALEWIEKRAFLLATAKEAEDEAKQITQAIGGFMLDAKVDTLTANGRKLLTYKKQKGRESFDTARLKTERPELVAEYTKQGADFMVMRTVKPKETK